MTRRLLAPVLLATALLAVPGIAAARTTTTTFTAWATVMRFEAVDASGDGMGMGDMYAGTNALSATRGGARNGTIEWISTIIRQHMPGGMEYRSVQQRFAWKRGTMLVNGMLKADQGVLPHSPMRQTLYVTGGSGAYAGARGTVTFITINKTERKFVFHLTDLG